MSHPFSSEYNPPIPVVLVRLSYGDGQFTESFQAIVDTGADATIIPEDIARQIRATPLNPGYLETQWGETHPVTIYLLNFEIENLRLPGMVVAGDPTATEIILGRNVLSKLPLFLDGPSQQTDLLDDATAKQLRVRRK